MKHITVFEWDLNLPRLYHKCVLILNRIKMEPLMTAVKVHHLFFFFTNYSQTVIFFFLFTQVWIIHRHILLKI